MNIGQALLLGIIQGLTEFLPVSSSGHLVLGKTILGIPEQGITFEVFVHFGTLLAVVTVFRKDILILLQAFFSLFKKSSSENFSARYNNDDNLRLLIYLIIATLPAVFVGLLFKDFIEKAFNDPHLVCIMLIVTAIILSLTWFSKQTNKPLGLLNTVVMGTAQALAILPGISRSGLTISAGLYLKISGNEAARFSFLLAIPAILGATILQAGDLVLSGIQADFILVLLAGTFSAYISGYIAIETLLGIVRRGKLYWFAPYCFIIGLLGLILV
ncbi:undecaprenyl-diphosphate phosphatase [candidate division KSB1 bacterium]|nr:undecaprenyl-diphosphate phosphatase [candidate division KSB1 bacterium]